MPCSVVVVSERCVDYSSTDQADWVGALTHLPPAADAEVQGMIGQVGYRCWSSENDSLEDLRRRIRPSREEGLLDFREMAYSQEAQGNLVRGAQHPRSCDLGSAEGPGDWRASMRSADLVLAQIEGDIGLHYRLVENHISLTVVR
jgi:hypothetical protein